MTPRVGPVPRVLIGGLTLVAVLAGCSTSGRDEDGRDANGGYRLAGGAVHLVATTDRKAPVALAGTTLEGDPLDLATLRGSVVVLNVWNSSCGPCRKEAPDLQAASVALGPRGVAFVGLNLNDRDLGPALAFQRRFGVGYPSLSDDGGRSLLALRGAVAPNALPSTVVLDRQGRVAARISGATTGATLVGLVEDVLAAT